MNLVDFYSKLLLGFLATPAGVAVIFMAGVLAVCAVTLPSARWFFTAAALYAATLPVNAVGSGEGGIYVPLAFPLEQLRVYSRPLTLMFLAILLLPLVTSTRGWRRTLISWPLALFFIFQIGIAVRLTSLDALDRGPLSMASYTVLFLTFGVAMSMWLQEMGDVYKLLYAICLASATVIVATCYQLAINRAPIFVSGRLSGVTGNPQFLGLIIAFTLPTICYLMVRGRRSLRPLLAVLIAISVILLIWTGSRTGMLGTVLGLGVLYHRRLGRFAISGTIVAVLVYLALPYFSGSTDVASRFLSSENTRAGVWNIMLEDIRNNFWFGASRGTLSVHENSYLAMLGEIGIVGTLPFIAAWLMMLYMVIRLQLSRAWLGEHQDLVDLITSFWVSIAVCAMFEGFLLGVVVFPVLAVYLFAAISTFLNDQIAVAQEQTVYDAYADPLPVAA